MKYNFVFNEENRPIVVAIEEHPQENGVLLEVPDEFDVMNAEDWKYEDGVWVYDPLPAPEPEPSEEMPSQEERIAALEDALAQTDEIAIELYEAQAEQEEINAAQDEALIEIYEMIGG